MSVEEKLRQLGLELPSPPVPVAAYLPCVRTGNILFISGQIPKDKGELKFLGYLGGNLTIEDGVQAARICTLNALSIIRMETGDFGKVRRIVKLTGYVASAPGFHDQPKVIDGASQLLVELFGDRGKHARAAVGVNELPLGVAVELEMIVEVDDF